MLIFVRATFTKATYADLSETPPPDTGIYTRKTSKRVYSIRFICKFVSANYCKPMLLSKEIAVELNLTGCRLKQFIASKLRQMDVPLTPEQFMLIDLLWNQGEMTQQQLADQMQKDKNSVTKLVDAIERKGFVVRQQNPHDRRANTLVLTEKANQLKPGAKQKGISILDEILDGISEDELRGFLATLNKLNRNMTVEGQE